MEVKIARFMNPFELLVFMQEPESESTISTNDMKQSAAQSVGVSPHIRKYSVVCN